MIAVGLEPAPAIISPDQRLLAPNTPRPEVDVVVPHVARPSMADKRAQQLGHSAPTCILRRLLAPQRDSCLTTVSVVTEAPRCVSTREVRSARLVARCGESAGPANTYKILPPTQYLYRGDLITRGTAGPRSPDIAAGRLAGVQKRPIVTAVLHTREVDLVRRRAGPAAGGPAGACRGTGGQPVALPGSAR